IRRRGHKPPAARRRRDQAGVIHLDGAIRTLLRTTLAADAPIADNNLLVVSTLYRVHGAADHADRIETRSASRGHKILAVARSNQKQSAARVIVRPHAGLDALVAARAAIEVNQHQLLAFDQTKLLSTGGSSKVESRMSIVGSERLDFRLSTFDTRLSFRRQ